MGSSSSKAAQTAGKIASSEAPRAARKYPTRSPPTSTPQPSKGPSLTETANLGPTVHPEVEATQSRTEAVERDASDPDLAHNARLRQIGPVVPNPTYSPSSAAVRPTTLQPPTGSTHPNNDPSTSPSTFTPSASNPAQSIFPTANPAQNARPNPAVSLLTARYRLAEEAEKEFEQTGRRGDHGRSFLDITTLRQMVSLREQGVQEQEIERRLGLRDGVVARLGRRGVVGLPR